MNSTVSIGIGILLILGAAFLAYWPTRSVPSVSPSPTPEATQESAPAGLTGNTAGNEGISMSEVATHADGASCWSAINGSVYDLTSWIPKHPGGSQAILQLCGTDGSETFNRQHGGAALQQQILAGFKIGVVR